MVQLCRPHHQQLQLPRRDAVRVLWLLGQRTQGLPQRLLSARHPQLDPQLAGPQGKVLRHPVHRADHRAQVHRQQGPGQDRAVQEEDDQPRRPPGRQQDEGRGGNVQGGRARTRARGDHVGKLQRGNQLGGGDAVRAVRDCPNCALGGLH